MQGVLLLTASHWLLSYLLCVTVSVRCLLSSHIVREVSIASLVPSWITGHVAILILIITYFGLKVKSKNRKAMKREIKANVGALLVLFLKIIAFAWEVLCVTEWISCRKDEGDLRFCQTVFFRCGKDVEVVDYLAELFLKKLNLKINLFYSFCKSCIFLFREWIAA